MTAAEPEDRYELPGAAHVGRVDLRVGSFEHVFPFYREVVGLAVDRDGTVARLGPADGPPVLTLREDPEAPARSPDAAGLYHVAIRVPDRGALGDALRRVRDRPWTFTGASDHLVSEALYLRDPAGNGLEIYRDRDRADWPEPNDGFVGLDSRSLDLDDLEAAARGDDAVPAGTDVGHVHLEVTDLAAAEAFYVDALGLRVRDRYGDAATFLAAGDYHHHVAVNTWNGRSEPAGETLGLDRWELVVPDAGTLETVGERLEARGHPTAGADGGLDAADPDGIRLRVRVEG